MNENEIDIISDRNCEKRSKMVLIFVLFANSKYVIFTNTLTGPKGKIAGKYKKNTTFYLISKKRRQLSIFFLGVFGT